MSVSPIKIRLLCCDGWIILSNIMLFLSIVAHSLRSVQSDADTAEWLYFFSDSYFLLCCIEAASACHKFFKNRLKGCKNHLRGSVWCWSPVVTWKKNIPSCLQWQKSWFAAAFRVFVWGHCHHEISGATIIHNLGTNTQISDFSSNKFRQYIIKPVEEWVNQILSLLVILGESLSMP